MKKIAAITLVSIFLSGCGLASMNQARGDIEKSKVAYKECLAVHPSKAQACRTQKSAYEADIRAFQTLGFQSEGYNINLNKESD